MPPPELFQEIIAMYQHHGWRLRRVLLRSVTIAALGGLARALFDEAAMKEADFDALWFTRPSPGGREAWELRLVAAQPYALFEAFEPDELEEQRGEVRLEMEARMKEYAAK